MGELMASRRRGRPGPDLSLPRPGANQFDGRPTLLVLDEAWLFLESAPAFAGKIREWLKTLRKLQRRRGLRHARA
jgi:hypothetical protein